MVDSGGLPTLVSGFWVAARTDRDFESHYAASMRRLAKYEGRIVLYCSGDLSQSFIQELENLGFEIRQSEIESSQDFNSLARLLETNLLSQGTDLPYPLSSSHYLSVTMKKIYAFEDFVNRSSQGEHAFWVDAGVYGSFPRFPDINAAVDRMSQLQGLDSFLVPTFFHLPRVNQVHGFPKKLLQISKFAPWSRVARATFWGGSIESLQAYLTGVKSIANHLAAEGFVFTEEVPMTLALRRPGLRKRELKLQPSGDVSGFFSSQLLTFRIFRGIRELLEVTLWPIKTLIKI